jgi:hypothetical protein
MGKNDRKLQGVSPKHFSPEVAQDFGGKFKAGNLPLLTPQFLIRIEDPIS